jgi:hypothetical protein
MEEKRKDSPERPQTFPNFFQVPHVAVRTVRTSIQPIRKARNAKTDKHHVGRWRDGFRMISMGNVFVLWPVT